MQAPVVAMLLREAANRAFWITGGDDGLQGMEVWPIFGLFRFDMFGRTGYLYCLVVLFLCWWIARRIVHSPFGRSLTGIRENVLRMHAIGAPVRRRRLVIYTISAAFAGLAGALIAQTTQFVGLGFLSLDRSAGALIMLIIGGVGRLYGAFIGVPLSLTAQGRFSDCVPVIWYYGTGRCLGPVGELPGQRPVAASQHPRKRHIGGRRGGRDRRRSGAAGRTSSPRHRGSLCAARLAGARRGCAAPGQHACLWRAAAHRDRRGAGARPQGAAPPRAAGRRAA